MTDEFDQDKRKEFESIVTQILSVVTDQQLFFSQQEGEKLKLLRSHVIDIVDNVEQRLKLVAELKEYVDLKIEGERDGRFAQTAINKKQMEKDLQGAIARLETLVGSEVSGLSHTLSSDIKKLESIVKDKDDPILRRSDLSFFVTFQTYLNKAGNFVVVGIMALMTMLLVSIFVTKEVLVTIITSIFGSEYEFIIDWFL